VHEDRRPAVQFGRRGEQIRCERNRAKGNRRFRPADSAREERSKACDAPQAFAAIRPPRCHRSPQPTSKRLALRAGRRRIAAFHEAHGGEQGMGRRESAQGICAGSSPAVSLQHRLEPRAPVRIIRARIGPSALKPGARAGEGRSRGEIRAVSGPSLCWERAFFRLQRFLVGLLWRASSAAPARRRDPWRSGGPPVKWVELPGPLAGPCKV